MEVFDKFYSVDEKDVDNSVKTLHLYRINYYYDFNNQELKLCIDRYLVIRESQHSYFIRDSKLKKTKRRVVNKLSNKKFAYPSVRSALYNFNTRAHKRLGHLTSQLSVAEKALELITEELKTNK